MQIQIPNAILDKESLFIYINNKLFFPDYFGFNWDSLEDCLMDLHWIAEIQIEITHEKGFCLPDKEFSIYKSIMYDCVEHWMNYLEHKFIVEF